MKKAIIGSLAGMALGLTVLTSCVKKLDSLGSETSIASSNQQNYLYELGAGIGGLIVIGATWYGTGKLEEHSESGSKNTY